VERLAGHTGVEVGELLGRAHELGSRLVPGAAQAHDLGLVHSAHAGEAADGVAFAPAHRGLGPLGRAAVVGQVAAGADRIAVDDRRRERLEPAGDGRGAHLVDQRQPLVDTPELHERNALAEGRLRDQVVVADAARDLVRATDVLERGVEIAAPRFHLRALQLEEPVRRGLGQAREHACGALVPPHRDGALQLVVVLGGEHERRPGRLELLALLEEAGIGSLERVGGGGEPARPHRREAEQLEVATRELAPGIGLLEERVGVIPGIPARRGAALVERILD
jgi:hypothetical protein